MENKRTSAARQSAVWTQALEELGEYLDMERDNTKPEPGFNTGFWTQRKFISPPHIKSGRCGGFQAGTSGSLDQKQPVISTFEKTIPLRCLTRVPYLQLSRQNSNGEPGDVD